MRSPLDLTPLVATMFTTSIVLFFTGLALILSSMLLLQDPWFFNLSRDGQNVIGYGVLFGSLALVYVFLVKNKRYLELPKEFGKESSKERRRHTIYIWSYLIVLLLVIIIEAVVSP